MIIASSQYIKLRYKRFGLLLVMEKKKKKLFITVSLFTTSRCCLMFTDARLHLYSAVAIADDIIAIGLSIRGDISSNKLQTNVRNTTS